MQGSKSQNLFMDISGIDCRDTNISFSVQNILNREYYPSLSIKPQQKIDKNNTRDKNTKSILQKAKKSLPLTPKSTRKQQSKLIKKQVKQSSKCKDMIEEKDTQDNSQTVKVIHYKVVIKQTPKRKLSKQVESPRANYPNLPSNKIQPSAYNRQRTKSNASIKSQRKVSQLGMEGHNGQAASSNISCHRRNSSSKDSGAYKQYKKANGSDIQEMKKKNENIVRNDYFQQMKMEDKASKKNGVAHPKKLKTKKTSQKNITNNIQKYKALSPRATKK